jgi:hypothetical protein
MNSKEGLMVVGLGIEKILGGGESLGEEGSGKITSLLIIL